MKVDGPYRHGRRFRLRIREGGVQRFESFDGEEDAAARRAELEGQANAHATAMVGEALEAYRRHMVDKGNRPRSVETTLERLTMLFRTVLGKPVGMLQNGRREIVESLEAYRFGKARKPLSVASRRNRINQGRTFLNWCKEQGVLRANPLDGYRVLGKVNRGKPQLTADEAVRFLATCYRLADDALAGRRTVKRLRADSMPQLEGAVGAACALWLGRRASEVVDRLVRDLDRGGTVLNVPDAKTLSGIGAYDIPPQLQPYLRRLAQGRGPRDRLFGQAVRHDLLRWVHRVCRVAGVPKVCTHALRGTWGSLARKNGAALEAVSRALGHASIGVTSAHYVTAEAEASARQREVEAALSGAVGARVENAPDLGSKVVPNSADASDRLR